MRHALFLARLKAMFGFPKPLNIRVQSLNIVPRSALSLFSLMRVCTRNHALGVPVWVWVVVAVGAVGLAAAAAAYLMKPKAADPSVRTRNLSCGYDKKPWLSQATSALQKYETIHLHQRKLSHEFYWLPDITKLVKLSLPALTEKKAHNYLELSLSTSHASDRAQCSQPTNQPINQPTNQPTLHVEK